MIIEKTVNSSAISALRYNTDTQILSITFKGGNTYDYPAVQNEEVEALASAPSVGKYFNAHIRKYAVKA